MLKGEGRNTGIEIRLTFYRTHLADDNTFAGNFGRAEKDWTSI
jgi:hypothetical protein